MNTPLSRSSPIGKRPSPPRYPKPPRNAHGKINWDAVMENIIEVVSENLHARPADIMSKLGWDRDDITTAFNAKVAEAKQIVERRNRAMNGLSPAQGDKTGAAVHNLGVAFRPDYGGISIPGAAPRPPVPHFDAGKADEPEEEEELDVPEEAAKRAAEMAQYNIAPPPSIDFDGSEMMFIPVIVKQLESKVIVMVNILPWCFSIYCTEATPERIVFTWKNSLSSEVVRPLALAPEIGQSEEEILEMVNSQTCEGRIIITPDNDDHQFVIREAWLRPDVFVFPPPAARRGRETPEVGIKVVVIPKQFKPREFARNPFGGAGDCQDL